MPKPAVKVELGFGDNAPGNWFTLDSATRGLLDNATYTLSGAVYYDVTQYLVDVSTARGKSRELDRFNAGRVTAHFDNRNRYFDPTFAASPFYGQIVPRRDIRFSAGGTVQFTGITDDWNLTYSPDGASVAEVTGFDGFSLLASQKLAGGTATSQLSGARINAVLSDSNVNWSATSRLIDAGQETLQADVIPANQEVIPYINLVEQSEPGVFFLDKSNYATFKDRSTGAPTSGTWVSAGVRTNLVTNPSFEASSGTVTVRTNLITNPSFETNTTSWGTNNASAAVLSTAQAFVGSQSYLATANGAGIFGLFLLSPYQAVTAGNTYTYSIYVRDVNTAKQFQANLEWYSGTIATPVFISGSFGTATTVTSSGWTRVSITATAPTGAVIANLSCYSAGTPTSGTQAYFDAALFEQSSVLGTYFDGSTAASGDFSYGWSGTANASTSVQTGVGLGNVTSNSAAIQSSDWALNGTKSLRIIPTPSAGTDTFASPGGDVGGMRLGMVAGGTYTLSGTIRLSASQVGPFGGFTRQLIVYYNAGAGYTAFYSAVAPQTAGTTRLSVTFTLPAGTTEAFVRLYNGASVGNGDVWWDSVMLEQSSTLGNYFDGSFPNTTNVDIYAWTGTANASTSTDTRNTFVPPTILADDGTGIGYTAVNVVYGSEQLYNQVTLVRANGGTVTTSDATSQAAYGIRNVEQTGLLHTNDTNMTSLASYLVNTYKNPEFRFESMDFILNDLSTANQITLLGLEIGSVCKIVFTPNGIAPSIVKYAEVLGLNHTATTESHRMTIKFQTLDTTSFILDDLQFGLLDLNNLGY